MDDKVINALATKYEKTPSQIILRWMLQRQIVPITKSSKEERIKQTTQAFGWAIDSEDLQKVDRLDEGMAARIGDWNPDDHE